MYVVCCLQSIWSNLSVHLPGSMRLRKMQQSRRKSLLEFCGRSLFWGGEEGTERLCERYVAAGMGGRET